MSEKTRDPHNRWRSVTVAFRVSPEENIRINNMVKISGMTKQDYISARIHSQEVTVIPSPRVYIGLKSILKEVLQELAKRTGLPSQELIETINLVTEVIGKISGK